MTHPLFAAIDAAIAEHGWPDGVKYFGLMPSLVGGGHACSVTLGTFGGDSHTGHAATVVDAAHAAHAAQQAAADLRCDELAKAALRKLAQDAGINPALVAA